MVYFFEELAEQVGKDPRSIRPSLPCRLRPAAAYEQERAANVKKRNYFAKYGDSARAVLEALLDKYAEEGIGTIETLSVLNVQP